MDKTPYDSYEEFVQDTPERRQFWITALEQYHDRMEQSASGGL